MGGTDLIQFTFHSSADRVTLSLFNSLNVSILEFILNISNMTSEEGPTVLVEC